MDFTKAIRTTRLRFSSFCIAFCTALGLAALALTMATLWPLQASAVSHEGGPIETISAAALFAAGVTALYRFPGLNRMYIGLVYLLLAERELDAGIYPMGSKFYWVLSSIDTLLDITVLRVVLAVLIIGGFSLHGIPNALRALKLRAPFLLVFVLAGLLACVAQVLEEVSSVHAADLSHVMIVRLLVWEEILEMFFSIGMLAAVLIGWPKACSHEAQNRSLPKLF
ncbi:hypothetical protein [uncultured Tateyamaria sp.]|uniref:hypothetical protein n=1 Tax=uncultured Tateyamaria sp. TaxID=455651 RepID=UPI0026329DDF|nr:hypothetical protein [uncultured Tateyamaria sp.]